jgi:hypothetical protein
MGVQFILPFILALSLSCLPISRGDGNSTTCDRDVIKFESVRADTLLYNGNFTSMADYVRLPGGYAVGKWCEKTEQCTLVEEDNLLIKEPRNTETCIFNDYLEALEDTCDWGNNLTCEKQYAATTFFSASCVMFHATSDFNGAGYWDVVGETLQISCVITRLYEEGLLIGGDPELFSFLCNQSDIALDKLRAYDQAWVASMFNTYEREIYYAELILATAREFGITPLVLLLFDYFDTAPPQSDLRWDFSSLSLFQQFTTRATILQTFTQFAIALLFFQEDYLLKCDSADDARHDGWHVLVQRALIGFNNAIVGTGTPLGTSFDF